MRILSQKHPNNPDWLWLNLSGVWFSLPTYFYQSSIHVYFVCSKYYIVEHSWAAYSSFSLSSEGSSPNQSAGSKSKTIL
jgi:hypothetical protein